MKMKEGERALVIVPPQYAYGDAGAPAAEGRGAVPPAATLEYDVTLLSFEKVLRGGGGQLRVCLRERLAACGTRARSSTGGPTG